MPQSPTTPPTAAPTQAAIEPATQPETWCHIAPYGSFKYMRFKDGKPLLDAAGKQQYGTQLLDKQAFQRILAAWDPASPVLVDREHWSTDEHKADSTAMAWVIALDLRQNGLWGLLRWTDIGYAEAVNRRLRWLSPVWDLDPDGRPDKLLSVGLTNTARFKDALSPVVNKADLPGDATPTPPPGLDGTPQKDQIHMEKFITLLGLPADATEADVLAAVQALITAQAEAAEAALNSEAEEAAKENEEIIRNKADFVACYKEHPESARAMLRTLGKAAAAARTTVTNKQEARRPPSFAAEAAAGESVKNKLEIFREMPEGAAKDEYQRANAAELLDLERKAATSQD